MRSLLAVLVAMCWLAAPAWAHTRSQSQSLWTVNGDTLDARVESDAVDVTRLYALGGDAPLEDTFAHAIDDAFTVAADGRPCARAASARARLGAAGRIGAELKFNCPPGALASGRVIIESRLFLPVSPSHLHFLALREAATNRTAEAVLTEGAPRAALVLSAAPLNETFWSALSRFFPVGAAHVISGLDHVAFILALVLLVRGRAREILFAATGFTLGHTVTLALAATGVLRPDTGAIEVLIAFTIGFVALEIGDGGRERMRAASAFAAMALVLAGAAALAHMAPLSPLIWFGLAAFVWAYPRGFPKSTVGLAAVFGLIHGCGFAGALNALDLPRAHLLASLLGFNLGVEAAQVVVIGAALLAGVAARRAPGFTQTGASLASAGLFGVSAYWFVARLLAL